MAMATATAEAETAAIAAPDRLPANRDLNLTMKAQAITNAFSVDVEDYFHVSAYAGVIQRSEWNGLPSRVARNNQRLLSLLDEVGVKGTFFILGWVAEHYPDVVREIASAGHEVACHGLTHDLVYRQSRETFLEETRRAKNLIEDVAGTAVTGYRAASFSITRASLWALDCLSELGFEYDSSIFPVRHDRYGIPAAPRYPFRYEGESGSTLVEFPMPCVKFGGWRMPVGGGGYFRIYPYALTRALLKRINDKEQRPFMFYSHPWEVDPDQPMFDAGRLSNIRHRTNLDKAESRLRRLFSDFRFAPARDVLAQQEIGSVKRNDLSALAGAAVASEA